jgi:hypothetical protein
VRLIAYALHKPESDPMDEILTRFATDIDHRVGGPLTFRLILQPLMAAILAVIAGVRDARQGKPPYFWALLTNPSHRDAMMKDGWHSVGKVFILAIVLDVIYQIIVLHRIYPGEALIVAFLLAILPYLLLRGLVTRIVSSNIAPHKPKAT